MRVTSSRFLRAVGQNVLYTLPPPPPFSSEFLPNTGTLPVRFLTLHSTPMYSMLAACADAPITSSYHHPLVPLIPRHGRHQLRWLRSDAHSYNPVLESNPRLVKRTAVRKNKSSVFVPRDKLATALERRQRAERAETDVQRALGAAVGANRWAKAGVRRGG